MEGIFQAAARHSKDWLNHFWSKRWLRRTLITLLVIVIIYTLGGFFGVPYLLRRTLTKQVASSVNRPITVGKIAFNPFILRLDLDRLHIADRDPQLPFVDLAHLRIQASWSSVWHLAPIIDQVSVVTPQIHVVRTGDQTFNFSDLLTPSSPPTPPSNKPPPHFAVYNIRVTNGAIYFDDRVLSQHHQVDQLQLGVPFIANLPSKVNIFVQPLLRMKVDGSPFRLDGKTKPFGRTQETVVDLSLHRLDLTRYVSYAPVKLPIKLPKGLLSILMHLRFVNEQDHPHIRVDGGASLDSVELHDATDAPLLNLNHAVVNIDSIEPLENEVHLQRIYIDGLNTFVVRNADGTTNLAALTTSGNPAAASKAAAAASAQSVTSTASPTALPQITPQPVSTPTVSPTLTPTASPTLTPSVSASSSLLVGQAQLAAPAPAPFPAAQATTSPSGKPPLNFSLGSFELINSTLQVTDKSQPTPATAALNAIHAKLDNLKMPGAGAAPYQFDATVGSGGAISAKGNLDLAHNQAQSEASLNQIDLPGLKAFAGQFLNGNLASGKFSVQASIKTDFTPSKFNAHIEPASLSIDTFDLRNSDGKEEPLAWDKFAVAVGQVDLASHEAMINEVRIDKLRVVAHRDRQGVLNLLAMIKQNPHSAVSQPAPRKEVRHAAKHAYHKVKAEQNPAVAAAANAGPQWRYQVASVVLDQASIRALDEQMRKPVKLELTPLQFTAKGISDNLAKPITLVLNATVNGKGGLKVQGNVAPAPLDGKLQIAANRLDLTPVNAYLEDQVNARLASALLTMNGVVTASHHRDKMRTAYRGDLTLGGVRILDKLTSDLFARWSSLSARRIDADFGGSKPKVHIGGLALSDFYARAILNSNGRLNISDITANPHERPRSITRAETQASPTPTPASTPAANSGPPPQPKPLDVDIALGGITLHGGRVNWTDNFIRPNYSADLTQIAGKVGPLSTSSTQPADVLLTGMVNNSAPLNINGSANPLTPLAYLNINAKADGVELPSLSTYSTKYIGYPIIKGTLTVDVHYLLQDQHLTATNHIFIDQLTFGDKVESKTALNLPVRLAVAVLKDPSGAINLDVPVSGSLNDPQFSVGGVILQVLKNLIIKAATAPFKLIASAFGGGKNSKPLNYVAFKPGFARLSPDDEKQLEIVAKALAAKPSLKLNITGWVDPSVDKDGLRIAKVDQAVREQADKADEGNAPLSKAEYDKYLKKAYKAAQFEKPRDFLGLAKSLPPDEMKKLMVANEQVSDADLHHLGDARANAVRAALVQQKIEPARLFVLPPKLDAANSQEGPATRAELSLS